MAQISQETLAEMIGTTRSCVSFFMNKFRKLGFITYNGQIEVHNSLLNAVLYDKPERLEKTSEAARPGTLRAVSLPIGQSAPRGSPPSSLRHVGIMASERGHLSRNNVRTQ